MDVGDDLKCKSSGQKWFLSIFYTETSIYSFSFEFLAFPIHCNSSNKSVSTGAVKAQRCDWSVGDWGGEDECLQRKLVLL